METGEEQDYRKPESQVTAESVRELRVEGIRAMQGMREGEEAAYVATPERHVYEDSAAVNRLVAQQPYSTSPEAGNAFHNHIQFASIQEGSYDTCEVKATTGGLTKQGKLEAAQRVREIHQGENTGYVGEGTKYDLYSERNGCIYVNEIKPFSPGGIQEAQAKLRQQLDIEKNGGGDRGMQVYHNQTFYDPGDGHIVLQGPADGVIKRAKELAKQWDE